MRRKECVLNGGEIRPQRRNLFTAVRRETNLKCLLLTTLVLASSAATGIWCRGRGPRGSAGSDSDLLAHSVNVSTSPMSQAVPLSSSKGISEEGTTVSVCGEGKVLMPAALILLLYLLYLVECWHSKAREMIARPKLDVNTVYRKVEEMRRARPIVWWQAICYHFERKTQQFTRYRHSDASPSSHVSCDNERVKTHTANASFYYGRNGLHDISKDLVDLEEFTVTQVQFRKTFIFHDAQSATDFEDQRASFFQDMEDLDSYVEMREGMELAKVTTPERMTCWADAEEPPWFGRLDVFWLCSLLLLSWPLRVVLEFNTAHLVYQVTKLFGTNCNCAISSVAVDSDISSPLVERGHVLPDLDHSHPHHRQSLQWLPRVLEFCKNKLKTAVNSSWDIYGSRHQQNNRISRFDPDPDDEKSTLIPSEDQHHQHQHQCQVNGNTNVFRDDDGLPRSVTLMLSQSQATTERFELSEIDRRDSEPFGSGGRPRGARSRGCPCNCGCGDSGFGISDNYFACASGGDGGGDNCSAASTVECDFSLIPSESRALLFMGQSQSENGSGAGVEIGTVGGGDGSAVVSRSCEVMTPITCENGLYPHPHSHSYLTCDSSDQNCELGNKGSAPDQDQNQHQCQECHAHEETHFPSAGNPPPRSISASTFHFQRVPRSESFQVLRTSMPRSATGVTIDLTYPVSASFSRDQSIDTADTESSPFQSQSQSQSNTSTHQTQTWTKKLRRSFTHRDFTSESRSRNRNRNNDDSARGVKYKEVGPSSSLLSPSESHHYVSKSKSGHWQWLEDVRPNFPVNSPNNGTPTPSLTKSKSATEYNM